MQNLEDYIASIEKKEHQEKFTTLTNAVYSKFPQLQLVFKWNEPMFVYKETFIISFIKTKKHITVSPEVAGIKQFFDRITACGYSMGKSTFRIKWEEAIDYPLLYDIIQFNLDEKQDYPTFWRKANK
ncbi:hypothetical protein GCM10025886_22410 [Tetragenococcus halophilus subsp. flandriensis]|uniref:iron chaperone n=1 Tax=Tetragenococcus halophilus TaxID=51669 RepID=UPI0023E96177|nr:DUF1801 domain-containing protein [Tetragenococcus halophilus]GMA09090.1 hypothetical protein GCM10025886_22410 [Tetragenococcus halophilus subsp. flandriensis]